MKFFIVFCSLLYLNVCSVSAQCIATPAEFTAELEVILADWSLTPTPVCPDAKISTRTQVLPTDWTDPESLSKFGNFWVFATGPKVITEWLQFAKDAKGNNTAFTEKVMFHVGSDYVDFTKKYHMVAFNLELMNAIWTEDDGKTSILASWDNIFNYFGQGFKVCKASSGTVSDMDNDCEFTTLDIEKGLRETIKGNSFYDLTGCNYGYPDNALPQSLADECETRCGAGSNTERVKLYCGFYNGFDPRNGSGSCVQQLKDKLGSTEAAEDKALVIRGFFEKCMAFYPWFTGRGFGYDPDEEELSGEEFIVRGDVSLARLESAYVNIFNP